MAPMLREERNREDSLGRLIAERGQFYPELSTRVLNVPIVKKDTDSKVQKFRAFKKVIKISGKIAKKFQNIF